MEILSTPQILINLLIISWIAYIWIDSPPDRRSLLRFFIAIAMVNLGIILAAVIYSPENSNRVFDDIILVVFAGYLGGAIFFYHSPVIGAGEPTSGARHLHSGSENPRPVGMPGFPIEVGAAESTTNTRTLTRPPVVTGLVGIAGALTVFLIVEVPEQSHGELRYYLKLVGFSIIGGYGGITIIEQAFSMIQVNYKNQVDDLKSESRADEHLIGLVDQQLDLTKPASDAPTLRKALANGTERAAKFAYAATYDELADFGDGQNEQKEELVKRAINIYDAISLAYPKHYWAFGQLGYWYHKKENFSKAVEMLKYAILERKNANREPIFRYHVNFEDAALSEQPDLDPNSENGRMLLDGLRQRLRRSFAEWLGSEGWKKYERKPIVLWLVKNFDHKEVTDLVRHVENLPEDSGKKLVDRMKKLAKSA